MHRLSPRRTTLLPALALAVAGVSPLAAQMGPAAFAPWPEGHTAAAADVAARHVPGFTPWFLRSLERAVEEGLRDGAAPGAALVVGHGGEVVLARGWGRTDWDPAAPAVTPETVYDLASVTKVAATTVALMLLVDEGALVLDDPLATHLDAWPAEGPLGRIRVSEVLAHRAGLAAGAPFWREAPREDDDPSVRDAHVRALAQRVDTAAIGRTLYSDLGPILAGFVVEAVAGEPLDGFLARRVYGPLGMRRTLFRPADHGFPAEAVAPTERFGADLLRGVVHDPSARALGGVAGNAGLFSSAGDLALLASALLWERPTRLVCRDVLRAFTARTTVLDRYGAGWEMPHPAVVWSEMFGPRAFGHTGYTGTSLWIDPEADLFVVLLTNRVNPTAANERHHALRRAVHDVVRRAHLGEEARDRVGDWRARDHWRGPDGCRGAQGMEALERLGHGVSAGWGW